MVPTAGSLCKKERKMGEKLKRKRRIVHPSSQLKYIALSILPALIMSLFCTFFLIISGELILRTDKDKIFAELSSITETINTLEQYEHAENTLEQLATLKHAFRSLEGLLKTAYLHTPEAWREARKLIFYVLSCVIGVTGLLSLLYSHRIAGAIHRIRRSIDMLADGKDMPPIRLRKHDEFRELAESVDRLRITLITKGYLKS
jgi:hypothetical protein